MWKALMFAISLLTLSATMAAQERRPWSFYIEGGAGMQQLAELKGITIPEGEAKQYLNKRGINSLTIATGKEKPVVLNYNIGVSYNPQSFLKGRSRVSLHLGNQNISQKSYHAIAASAEMMIGYDILRHPHHDLSIEVGAGAYATFNRMNYTWRGLDGDGNQIYIKGVPEQVTVELGWHNTVQPSVPVRVSYTYNIGAHSWLGIYAQGRYIPRHDSYVPTYTASAGITYRFTIGKKKQAYVRPVRVPKNFKCPVDIDTVHVHDSVCKAKVLAVHDTVYVEKLVEKKQPLLVLFETGSSRITEYETIRFLGMDFPEGTKVELTGFACRIGENELKQRLAQKRVDAVRQMLEGRGVEVVRTFTHVSKYIAPNFRAVEIKFIEK